jgi:hypothetical protein
MPDIPEQIARHDIDAKRIASGWLAQDRDDLALTAGRGIARQGPTTRCCWPRRCRLGP